MDSTNEGSIFKVPSNKQFYVVKRISLSTNQEDLQSWAIKQEKMELNSYSQEAM